MKISLIAAMDQNGLIGANNGLPWHLSEDLKHFKRITMGKPVLMGRKTYESIGRPLPGRQNIVLTTNQTLIIEGCDVVHSFTRAIELVNDCAEIMIIGGSTIYELIFPQATHMYLTLIHASYEGDTYFPKWERSEWSLIERDPHTTEEGLNYEFTVFERLVGLT